LNEEDFDKIFKKVALEEKEYVPQNECEKWMNANLISQPTKLDLDD
jgi:hypothetical protein